MSDLTTLTDRMAREPGQWVHLIRFALETLLEPAAETLRGLRIQAEDGEEFFESPRHLVNAFEDVVRLAERRSGR